MKQKLADVPSDNPVRTGFVATIRTPDGSPGQAAEVSVDAFITRDTRTHRRLRRWLRRIALSLACILLLGILSLLTLNALFPFPLEKLDQRPSSPVVTARGGEEILSITGRDGHWHMPVQLSHVSCWMTQATIAVEDQRFEDHPGIDPVAACRAAIQNATNLRVVSGASTLTMQLCRMASPRPRTMAAKAVESFRALQLERLKSKDEILACYLNAAPYGGNLRGVQAAARRYFNKSAADLSLAEAALLAGLPQSPERYRPDRHLESAKRRRDFVLSRMNACGMIDKATLDATQNEPVACTTTQTTNVSRGVAWAALARRPLGGQLTIDWPLQLEIERLIARNASLLPAHTQIAAAVIDIDAAEIRAWVGSIGDRHYHDSQVDGVLAKRSPGSALKPFIYAAAFESGRLAPSSLVHDLPVNREGWEPRNFEPVHAGSIRADEALRRSLNVPAILITEQVGLSRCAGVIRSAGIDLPAAMVSRAGLSLAVGGVEVSLLDLTNAYGTIGRGGVRRTPRLFADDASPASRVLDQQTCSTLDDILSNAHRSAGTMSQAAPTWFMWKTGTSSGRRDAWAVGHNRRFAIGVWVGRFSGAGNYEYVGKCAAEPLLATLFTLPALATTDAPDHTPTLIATRELPPPPEAAVPVRIVSPAPGARYIAIGPTVEIHPRANRDEGIFWFLNGEAIDRNSTPAIHARVGRNELLCSDATGQADRIVFDVVR